MTKGLDHCPKCKSHKIYEGISTQMKGCINCDFVWKIEDESLENFPHHKINYEYGKDGYR